MKRLFFAATVLFCILSLLTGCALFESAPLPTLDTNMINTYAASTVSARQTFSALETLVAVLTAQPTGQQPSTQPTSQATGQPAKATATSLPPTLTPVPSLTPVILPSATATPRPPTATATSSIPCLYASFVTDVTIPDGTTLAPGAAFTKTWRLLNKGTCTWTTSFTMVFSTGNAMSGAASTDFPQQVKPGQTVDLSIKLIAPTTTGSYSGYYQLKDASGVTFGLGIDGKNTFYVKINVAVPSLTDLHLATQTCSAVWKSQAGTVACPTGSYDFTNGSVTTVAKPKLEGGYTDDETAIVMVPNNGQGGYIIGRFPATVIKSGDHFITLLGLMDGYTKGSVIFLLNYSVDGGADQNLGTWSKSYTSSFIHVDIDLSSLAGKNVQFVLKVLESTNSSTDDVAFWLNPYIKRP
jgi:hypothetical protein